MMDNSIESQLANWLSKKLGVEITPGNDEPVQIDIQNTSHGILRIQEDDHGVNDEIYTEEASYVIEYIIHEDDNEEFLKKVRSLALTEKASNVEFEDNTLSLEDGIRGKFYFGKLIQSAEIVKSNGEVFIPYELSFSLNLYESLIPSDDLLVTIDGNVLKGIISCVPTYSFSKEGFVRQGETLPQYEPQSKTLVVTISYLPLAHNEASNALIEHFNTLDEESVDVSIKWPYESSAEIPTLLNVSGKFFIKDLTLNLNKGNYGGLNVVLVKENSNGWVNN